MLTLLAVTSLADAADRPSSDSLRKKIGSLAVPDVAWRKIPWKTCLLDGLLESQRTKKPLMLWVFIDRPVDDTRC
jgi:hypothetical protein